MSKLIVVLLLSAVLVMLFSEPAETVALRGAKMCGKRLLSHVTVLCPEGCVAHMGDFFYKACAEEMSDEELKTACCP